MLANGTPVIAKDILKTRYALRLDGGFTWSNGRQLFGSSKTIRGVLLSVLVTSALAPLVGLEWEIGARVAATAMLGDLLSSFLKRRMNLPSGSRATGLDQIPESLFPVLACRNTLALTDLDIVTAVALFLFGDVLLSIIFFRLHLRDRPY